MRQQKIIMGLVFLAITACGRPHHNAAPILPIEGAPVDGPPNNGPYTLDPCGPGPGQDEILLVFEGPVYVRNVKGRLIDLGPGQYRTKDRQRCKFTINSEGAYNEE